MRMTSATLACSLATGSGTRRHVNLFCCCCCSHVLQTTMAQQQLPSKACRMIFPSVTNHTWYPQALGVALDQAQLLKHQLDRANLLSSDSVRDRLGEACPAVGTGVPLSQHGIQHQVVSGTEHLRAQHTTSCSSGRHTVLKVLSSFLCRV